MPRKKPVHFSLPEMTVIYILIAYFLGISPVSFSCLLSDIIIMWHVHPLNAYLSHMPIKRCVISNCQGCLSSGLSGCHRW